MIKVTIELESAKTGQTTKLGQMCISNDGTLKGKLGNYNIAVCRKGSYPEGFANFPKNPLREGKVKMYPRLAYNVWRLVCRALQETFPEENK